MTNIALIGSGYWGQIYQKTLKNISEINLIGVYTHNYKDIFDNNNVEGVIIATPTETHYEITKDCLLAGKHVLVEKPFTDNSDKAFELFELSKKMNKVLLVGHIYLHHPGIIKIKELIDDSFFGDIEKFISVRVSTNKNKNALWEMMPHDIYILDYLFGNEIKIVKSKGTLEHCNVVLKYKDTDAYVEVNASYPVKLRQIMIKGTKKTIRLDDEARNKFMIINNKTKKETFTQLDYSVTPLEKQCRHFIDCITNGVKPISGALDGFKNVVLLEKINETLSQ